MNDLYFDEEGDLLRDSSGDIALTETPWRDDLQQCYIRLMTDIGDFLLYPQMGCNLSQLYGFPQSPQTGQAGINLIQAGLTRENKFTANNINVKAVPISFQALRFDVNLTSGSQQIIRLQVAQNLGVH